MERGTQQDPTKARIPRPGRRFGRRAAAGSFIAGAMVFGGAASIVTAFAHHIVSTTPVPTTGIVGKTALGDSALLGATTTDRTVKFFLWAPSSPSCTGTPVLTDVQPVTAAQGNGSAPVLSGTTIPVEVGTYHWTAEILNGSTVEFGPTACTGEGSEPVVVSKATPDIDTTPSAGGAVGGSIHDTASVGGGDNPTGQVRFELFQPSDAICDGNGIDAGTKTLDSHGKATSDLIATSSVGTYHWVATYLGDANNKSVQSACSEEPVAVGKASPSISTEPSAGGVTGTSISDSATVSGGSNPTGTVTFKLYGPGDTSCNGNALFTSTVELISATVHSAAFSGTDTAGTYSWVASYSGDASNASATSECAAETVVITSQPTPTPTPSPTSSVEAVSTPSTGSDPTGSVGLGIFLILGGPAVLLTSALIRGHRRSK